MTVNTAQKLAADKTLTFIPAKDGILPSSPTDVSTTTQATGTSEIVYVQEFVVLTEDCKELVSTDSFLTKFDGIDIDAVPDCSVDQQVDANTGNQNTVARTKDFAGCYYDTDNGGGNDIDSSSETEIVKGTVAFDYDLYLREGANVPKSIELLESNILKSISADMKFGCERVATSSDNSNNDRRISERQRSSAGTSNLIGISSKPVDVVDERFSECTSTSTTIKEDEFECVPINGKMTYYVTDEDAGKAAEATIRDAVREGADDGTFLTPPDLLDMIYVEDRAASAYASNSIPPTTNLNNTDLIIEDIKASTGKGGVGAAGASGGISGVAIGGISMAAASSIIILGIAGYRRRKVSTDKMAEEQNDSADFVSDGVEDKSIEDIAEEGRAKSGYDMDAIVNVVEEDISDAEDAEPGSSFSRIGRSSLSGCSKMVIMEINGRKIESLDDID